MFLKVNHIVGVISLFVSIVFILIQLFSVKHERERLGNIVKYIPEILEISNGQDNNGNGIKADYFWQNYQSVPSNRLLWIVASEHNFFTEFPKVINESLTTMNNKGLITENKLT